MPLEPGLVCEKEFTVQENESAQESGGEDLPPVFGTPRLVSHMEDVAHTAVYPYLSQGQTTVGTLINVRHLAATPIGMKVRLRAELIEIDRRRLLFKIEGWDETEKIADGTQERYIIDKQRFMERIQEKIGAARRG